MCVCTGEGCVLYISSAIYNFFERLSEAVSEAVSEASAVPFPFRCAVVSFSAWRVE